MVTERDRPLANRRPNPAMDRLQAEPMLIRGPHLDGLVGMLLGQVRTQDSPKAGAIDGSGVLR